MLKIKEDVCSYSVYKHTFHNSKIYVGITFRNPKIRWGNGNNYSNNKYMTNAIRNMVGIIYLTKYCLLT